MVEYQKDKQLSGSKKRSRTQMSRDANRILKQKFLDKGITKCELTGSSFGLTFAHRKKRRYYKTVEELSDFNEVILVTLKKHMELEKSGEKTEEAFKKLRG